MKHSRHSYLYSMEKGTLAKPFGLRCNIALVFPDRYEPAMSNLGFQTVYRFLNSFPDINCERFFYDEDLPFSFENKRNLKEFDVVAFSFPFEPGYIKAMQLLQENGINLACSQRHPSDPLIIAGGIATRINSKALEECIDFIFPGDIEYAGTRLSQCLLDGNTKISRLENLKNVFNTTFFPESPVPCQPRYSQIITPCTTLKNKLLIEVTRGCPYNCTFCFTGSQNNSFLQCSWLDVKNVLLNYSIKDLGIISSAVGSWQGLKDLLLFVYQGNYRVSFSSLRFDEITDDMLDVLLHSGQHSLTLAPETGDEELRFLLNKKIVNEKIFSIVEKALNKGFQQVKLYFMVGLPGESKSTQDRNLQFFTKLNHLVKKCSRDTGKIKRILIKTGIFVPKPFTPLSQTPPISEALIRNIFSYYRQNQQKLDSLSFDYDSIRSYSLQYILSNYSDSLLPFFQAWCTQKNSTKRLINEYLSRFTHA